MFLNNTVSESSDAAARYCLWSKASGDAALSSWSLNTVAPGTACVNKRQLMCGLSFHHWILHASSSRVLRKSFAGVQWEKEAPGEQWMGGRSLLQRWADFVQNRQAQAQSRLFIGLHQDVEPDAREKEKESRGGKALTSERSSSFESPF